MHDLQSSYTIWTPLMSIYRETSSSWFVRRYILLNVRMFGFIYVYIRRSFNAREMPTKYIYIHAGEIQGVCCGINKINIKNKN